MKYLTWCIITPVTTPPTIAKPRVTKMARNWLRACPMSMKMVRIFTKVVMVMARMEVMEPNAVRFMMGFPPQMHQSINNRITLLKKENARLKVFLSVHHWRPYKSIANMMTDLSTRGSPSCHFREDLVKAEKHFILFNVHCHRHSVFVSSSQIVPISINNTARTL